MNILSYSLSRLFCVSALTLATLTTLGGTALAQSNTSEIRIDHSLRNSIWVPGAVRRVGNAMLVGPHSYQVASINSGGFTHHATRPFFVFNLGAAADQPGTITGAKLRLFHPSTSLHENVDPSETIRFHEVTTPIQALRSLQNPPIDPSTGERRAPTDAELGLLGAVFDDLGDGPAYGSITASASNQGSYQELQLNQAALTSLNKALRDNQEWAVGGTLASIDTTGTHPVRSYERIFRDSHDQEDSGPRPASELVLTFGQVRAAPAPALGGILGISLLGTGLAGLGLRRREQA